MFQWSERMSFVQRMTFVNDLHKAGVEGKDLLSRLYCEFLPDTAQQQGDLMAQHVLERIRAFDETRENLLVLERKHERDKRKLLREDFMDLLQGMSMGAQCRQLRWIGQGMDSLSALCRGDTSRKNAAQEKPSAYMGSESEAGRDAELDQVLEKILDPRVSARVQKAVFPQRETWMDEDLYRGILTISLYTMMCNGECGQELGELPVSMEYVAMEVCCGVSAQEGAEKNETAEEARHRDWIDSTAVKLFLAAGVLVGGTATVLLASSALVVYSAYYVTVLAVGGLVISAAVDEDANTAARDHKTELTQDTTVPVVRTEEKEPDPDTDKAYS